jgi:hypothetical protein
MTETKIRQKLADFCKTGDLKKVKAMYTMVEDDINEANDWDEEFIKELDRRTASFLDGTAKMYTWEETKQAAIDRVKEKKRNGLPIKNT